MSTYENLVCEFCNDKFISRYSDEHVKKYPDRKNRFCSIRCMYEWRKKISRIECNCIVCGKKFFIHKSDVKYNRGKYCSKSCGGKAFTKNFTGENHPFWKGDDSTNRKFSTHSQAYRKWRKIVLERDHYTCVKCKSQRNLEVDHIKPKAIYPELVNDISNGRTLCHDCHTKTPTYGKSLTKEQFEAML